MQTIVIIPTYNEAENIGKMISALGEQFAKFPEDRFTLLVVEGNSPDGTADVVRKSAETIPYVHLLMEEKKALISGKGFFASNHSSCLTVFGLFVLSPGTSVPGFIMKVLFTVKDQSS